MGRYGALVGDANRPAARLVVPATGEQEGRMGSMKQERRDGSAEAVEWDAVPAFSSDVFGMNGAIPEFFTDGFHLQERVQGILPDRFRTDGE